MKTLAGVSVAVCAMVLAGCSSNDGESASSSNQSSSSSVSSTSSSAEVDSVASDSPESSETSSSCAQTGDLVVYTTYTDGGPAEIDRFGPCSILNGEDTVSMLRSTAVEGTCQYVALDSDNPDVKVLDDPRANPHLNKQIDAIGDGCR